MDYATLEYISIEETAKTKIAIEAIKEKFDATSFSDILFEIEKDNVIKSIKKVEKTTKYGEEEIKDFAKFLSEILAEGVIVFAFTEGNGHQWGYAVFPELIVKFYGKYVNTFPENFLNKETISKITTNKIAKRFFEKIFDEYFFKLKENMEKVKKAKLMLAEYEYEIRIPTKEKRIVQYDLISFFKNKKEANKTINKLQDLSEEGLSIEEIKKIISIDETEDIDIIDAWEDEINAKDAELEKIKI